MSIPANSRRRVIVISDLHLGGEAPHMMSRPQGLADFIASLPKRLAPDEHLELVINGDFVDFLAVPPWVSWTSDPKAAAAKLLSACASPFDVVFDALKVHLARGHRLTVIVGNHDVELTYPAVQRALNERLGSPWPNEVCFVDDGSAWRVGGALIEHGNRYDCANLNDWERLRATRSWTSRGEPVGESVRPSVGSNLVTHVLNPLKVDYPFLDLLQPEGELLALLLLVLEPSLAFDFGKIKQTLRAARLQARNPSGNAPSKTYQVSASGDADLDPELVELFGDDYRQMRLGAAEQVGAQDWMGIITQTSKGSLKKYLTEDRAIPPKRLKKLQALIRRLLPAPDYFAPDGDPGPYGKAAERIRKATGVETVVMGHTHLMRQVGPQAKATYINTGTWADVIRVPAEAVIEGEQGMAALTDFFRRLLRNEARIWVPSYADLRLRPDLTVAAACLSEAND